MVGELALPAAVRPHHEELVRTGPAPIAREHDQPAVGDQAGDESIAGSEVRRVSPPPSTSST